MSHYKVLDEYTDEHIDAATAGRTDRWADGRRALRTVPAEWRQSVLAAAHAIAYRYEIGWARPAAGTRMALSTFVPTGIDMDDAITRKVAEFHAGHLPMRVESLADGPEEVP